MKQYHLQQETQRLNIHWDVSTLCQYKCSYCYARKDYKEGGWNKLPKLEKQLKIIDAISSSYLPYNLGLLGGEPTLYPHYNKLITYIHNKLKPNDKLYVVTNGVGDFSKHLILDKLIILWSYHPEFVDEKEFLRNILVMQDKGFKFKINIMLHPGRKYWEQLKSFILKCKKLNLRIHPHFMYTDVYNLFKYSEEFWDYFKFLEDITEKDLKYGESLYNDYSLFYNKLNQFKGWDCYNNNFEIDINGNVNQFCVNNIGTNILNNLDFFSNIKEIRPIICQFSSCNCDGLLKQLKVKNVS